jgi:hypothetical protein
VSGVLSVLSVPDGAETDEPIGANGTIGTGITPGANRPFVPSVLFVPAFDARLPVFLEGEDWPEPLPGVDLDRVLETDWDDIAGIDLRHLFR